MAVYRTYQCPVCEQYFDFLHHPNDEPPPDRCLLCNADVSGKKKTRKVKKVDSVNSPGLAERLKYLPRPGSRVSRSADAVQRGMENASIARMNEAAEVLGVSPSTLSNMKMTDMKDNLREGEMSQSTTPSDATQLTGSATTATLIDSTGSNQTQNFTPFQNNARESLASAPRTGINNLGMINSLHQTRGAKIVSAGRINKK